MFNHLWQLHGPVVTEWRVRDFLRGICCITFYMIITALPPTPPTTAPPTPTPPLARLLPISYFCYHFISLLITMYLYCCMCILTDDRGNVGCLKFPFFKCLCCSACNHFYWGLVLVYSSLVLIFYAHLHPLPLPPRTHCFHFSSLIHLAVTHCIKIYFDF